MKKVLVIGANFAGSTAALEIKRRLKDIVRVTVIDPQENSLYFPSLIWVPISRRNIEQCLIPRKPVFDKYNVDFVLDTALSVDPDRQIVITQKNSYTYDHLVIATGAKANRDIVPGLREHGSYIGSVGGALQARQRLNEFKSNPGPIVIGATQKASCMGAGYEFLYNVDQWLREQKIRNKVDVHWITPEPYLGHFGIDGMPLGEFYLKLFNKFFNIKYHTGVGVKEVTKNTVVLDTGETLASSFTMLMVPFTGVDFIANSPKLEATSNYFLDVKPNYQHKKFPNIWVAGLAVDVPPPFKTTKVPFGVPKTGYPSDVTGKIVATNVCKALHGKLDFKEDPWGRIPALCIMDAGKKEVIILGSSLFKPRIFAVMIPNIFNDISKVLLEKYFIWKIKHGFSFLL